MDMEKAYNLIIQKLGIWMREFIKLLPNIALAVLVFILGIYLAKVVKKLAVNIIGRFSHHQTVNNLFTSFIHLLVVAIALFVALSILNLDKAVTSILAGAGILGIGLAFAFQDIAANFMSGILISFRRPFKAGDIIKTNDYMGKVKAINLRDTVIRTFEGQVVIIPNKEIYQKSIENYTSSGKRRLDMTVGVSYGEDLMKVKQVTLQALSKLSHRDPEEPVRFFYEEFADSSINFILQIWLNDTDQPIFLAARSEAVMLIKQAYNENGITIPYPIRTLDFGIKGGEKLSEMILNITQPKQGDTAE